jgi:predicted outer membrane repeat protein
MKLKIFSIMFALALVVGISLIMAAPATANGSTWYVDPSGTDDEYHGTGPGTDAFLTIGYALTYAISGDTINVAAGTYEENINLKDGVSVYGAGAGSSIIDGGSNGPVVTANSITSATTLDGFTIQNGSGYENGGYYYGGGMYSDNSSPTVVDCLFSSNSVATSGGGIYNYNHSSPAIINCIFDGNSAAEGAGVANNEDSDPTLTNCTFYGNTASSTARAVLCRNYSDAVLTNCIIWDGGSEIAADGYSSYTVDYCDSYGFAYSGTGNISADPSFVDADNGNFRLSNGSPCIDVGNNAAVPGGITTDFYGDTRIVDGNGDTTATVDMGAAENQALPPDEVWVDNDYCDVCGNDGHTWGYDAFDVIQDGIDAVTSPGTVHVAAGTYTENITLKDGANVLGAGATSIIDGNSNGTVVYADTITTATTFSGFTIQNGSGYGLVSQSYGGGMYVTDSSALTVSNCTFSGNSATHVGGGIYTYNSPITVTNCAFNSNSANNGGGMYNNNSSPTLDTCTFTGNTASLYGGGMGNSNTSSPTVTGCTFTDNSATNGGGGMFNMSASNAQLTNCDFNTNQSPYGAGMYNWSSSPALNTCTFTGNTATSYGGGMYNGILISEDPSSDPTLTNCTFTSNSASNGGGMYNDDASEPTLGNCDFIENTASNYGGGMYNKDASSPTMVLGSFTNNSATDGGGGMYNYASSPTVNAVGFTGNVVADGSGGGMANYEESSPTLSLCAFNSNAALYWGGGMHNNNSSPTVLESTFLTNTATEYGGGGMSNDAAASPLVNSCFFLGNTTTGWGGGMLNSYYCDTVVTSCVFAGNTATDASYGCGGGMMNSNWSSPTVANCTFYNNAATASGDGLHNDWNATPAVVNSILWDGGTDEIYSANGAAPTVNYCDIQGEYAGTGNINADPLFVDPSSVDFHIQPASPCIDAGSDSVIYVGIHDFDDEPRVLDGDGDGTATVDMGADECLAQVWVDNDYCDGCENDGHTWDFDAFDTIQEGVDAVFNGGTINVHPGEYTEVITIVDKSLTVASVSGDWHDTTVDLMDYVFGLFGDGGGQFDGDVAISGFALTGSGCGVYISDGLTAGSTVTVSNCLIHGNSSVGIYGMGTLDGDIFINDCIIAENGGSLAGIHLAAVGGTVEITDSVIGAYWDATTSTSYAGNTGKGIDIGVIAAAGSVLIDGNKIVGNGGYGISDGISGLAGRLTITNNIIGAYDYDLTSQDGYFDGNGGFGIFIDSWAPGGVLVIEGNRIAENYTGIMITATVAGECLINNNYVGAWTEYIDVGGEIYTQTFTGNVRYGMVIAGVGTDASLTIINNKVAENSTIGPGVALLVFGNNGNTIISANHVGAWTQDIPGGVPVSYGGNYCSGIAIMSATAGSLLILDNTVVGNHEPNSGIHIADVAEGVDAHVNLNDIMDNTGYGVYYKYNGAGYLEAIDATNNWWGATDGPGGEGPGSGDEVSTRVNYEPWLGVTVDNAKAGAITDGTLDNVAAAGVEVVVNGSATVTTANYSGNPGSGFNGDIGKYIDVFIDDASGVTELEVRLYYTDAEIAGLNESSLVLRWWNGTDWVACSDSGVNTEDTGDYSGYIWAKIRSDTTPTLADLTGSVFGGRGADLPSGPQVPYSDTNAPRIAYVMTCYDGVSETTADICWKTSEPATSQVEYWASSSLLSPLDTSYVTQHHVQLTDLTPGTTYYYQTMSEDRAGNLAISDVYSFTTLGEAPAAIFTTSDLSISPSEVSSGEEVTVTVLVTNSSDLAGSYELTLEINGVAEETREVTLNAGASQTVSFTVSKEATGSYSVAIDGLSGSFTIIEAEGEPADEDETLTEEESSANWPLIWGIIGGVVVIALVVFLVTMRRRGT